jgi:hypothetical protein
MMMTLNYQMIVKRYSKSEWGGGLAIQFPDVKSSLYMTKKTKNSPIVR